MKVILNADIEKLGEVGDTVEVKPGFARNYLLPRELALTVNKHNIDLMKIRKVKHQKKMEIEKLSAEEQKQKLEALSLEITKKAGENGVLFGSVTPHEVQDLLEEMGVQIERKKFHFDEAIKRVGHYTFKIKLFKDVEAEMKLEVIGEGEYAAQAPEAEVVEAVEEEVAEVEAPETTEEPETEEE
jgi:large subunit ribosomal protein L9